MKRKILNIILIICMFAFVGSSAYLIWYFRGAKEAEDALEQLSRETVMENLTEEERKQSEDMGVLEKYFRLHEKNQDLAGWIQVGGTKIDYPVMQNQSEPEYYLHRNFDREEDQNGLPFLDAACDIKNSGDNFLVYGHHMKSGLMFTGLLSYGEKEFYNQHKEITFDTIYKEGTYQVFAAFYEEIPEQGKEAAFMKAGGEIEKEQFEEYVKYACEKALYPTGITPVYGQQLLTLVTCSYHANEGRFIVVAVKK